MERRHEHVSGAAFEVTPHIKLRITGTALLHVPATLLCRRRRAGLLCSTHLSHQCMLDSHSPQRRSEGRQCRSASNTVVHPTAMNDCVVLAWVKSPPAFTAARDARADHVVVHVAVVNTRAVLAWVTSPRSQVDENTMAIGRIHGNLCFPLAEKKKK